MRDDAGMKSYDVEFGRRRIHVTEAGDGPAVILLHGGGPGASGMSNYSRNVDALARDFRVIVPDMQGYGQSTKGVDRSDVFGDLADAMLSMMDAMGVEKAGLVGNSLGGGCALRMAMEQPEKVSSLVLMGPGGIGSSRGAPTKGLKLLLNYYKGEGPTLAKLKEFVHGYLVYDPKDVPDELIEKRFQASLDPEVVANPPLQGPNSIRAWLRIDLTRDKRLRRCEVPTLALWGTEDKTNRPSGGAYLQKTMPNCDLYLFSKTGHWVQWERPEEFNAVTAAFVRKHNA